MSGQLYLSFLVRTQALSLGACHLGDMSGLHWSTERHAHTPQASVLFALIFARGASIFCSKRAACLSCASPSSAHRSQPCSCPCIGSCTSRHHTCGVNAWPWPGARTSAAAKGERQRVSQIQAYSDTHRRELYTTGRSDEREAEARERELVL